MPVLATIQYPAGRDPKCVNKVLVGVSKALETALDEQPGNIRVTVKEVPRNRYSVGGTMAYEFEKNDFKLREEK